MRYSTSWKDLQCESQNTQYYYGVHARYVIVQNTMYTIFLLYILGTIDDSYRSDDTYSENHH